MRGLSFSNLNTYLCRPLNPTTKKASDICGENGVVFFFSTDGGLLQAFDSEVVEQGVPVFQGTSTSWSQL
jgi:hypothetical protein